MRRLDQFFPDRLRDFDKIAQKIIVFDAQGARARQFRIMGLQTGNHLSALVAQGAGLVEFGQIMRLDETTITGFERQTVGQRLVQFHLKLRIDLLQVPTGKGHFTGQ